MPSATPQDADYRFVTTLSGSFSPNLGAPPAFVNIPSGCTLVRNVGAGLGVFDFTLPATYTPSMFQVVPSLSYNQVKAGINDTLIFMQLVSSTLPLIRMVLTNSAGVGTDFGLGQIMTFDVRLKYFTVLTF